MDHFKLVSDFSPKGDQPKAIRQLVEGIKTNRKHQTLLGVTGSGKTFVLANVIRSINKPTLVISHNKTLAAQLYMEFKMFFPNNAVEYFVSYYDYYQPEAYIPQTDTYIEKDSSINDELDRLRLAATSSLLSRRDVIIVASVSCIYGLGSPDEWKGLLVMFQKNDEFKREHILRKLIDIQYERNDIDFHRGTFRVKGDTIEIFPSYEEIPVRIELFEDRIDRISQIDYITGKVLTNLDRIAIYPAKHFVTTSDRIKAATEFIKEELEQRLADLKNQGKLVETQRLETKTKYDLEMLNEIGYCAGIENYSRYLSGRKSGEKPYTLIDYFNKDFLTIIDESHVSLPQIRGMYKGDRSRKQTLVDFGFRLPSALDNRPLNFVEFEEIMNQVIFVSATPSEYELELCRKSRKDSGGEAIELIIRPTGLVDPKIEVRPTENQIEDLMKEIQKRVAKKERVLVTTLTKRMAEDLAEYLNQHEIRVRYLHSEIDTIKRVDILRDLRLAKFDVLVGINLLREGLDLPEVSLVVILDADKEGFLRSETSLVQTIGRTARNVAGTVIMYADEMTLSMEKAIGETERRRRIQTKFNKEHGITPKTIQKEISRTMLIGKDKKLSYIQKKGILDIKILEKEMVRAAENLEFEKAAEIRDEIFRLKAQGNRKK
ncbi:MAG: excinuclease ABC subunit UvrB [bacterium]|nr:excinuclease ABC subunit UvrB [bacterium]